MSFYTINSKITIMVIGHVRIQENAEADTLKGIIGTFTGMEHFYGLGDHVYCEVLRIEDAVRREFLWKNCNTLRQLLKVSLGIVTKRDPRPACYRIGIA